MSRVVAALAGLALLVTGCSGTQEARTPVYLVVAEADRIGIVASPLPPGTVPESTSLEWLEGFEHELPGEVVDLTVARDLPTRVFVAYRDAATDSDHVQAFTAGAVRPGAPETFAPDGDPIDVGAAVRAAGPLTTPDLCTRAVRTSSDGRWMALLHEPAACGMGAAGAAVVLLDLQTVGTPGVAFPVGAQSREDAATPPVFLPSAGGGEPGVLVYAEADGSLVRVRFEDDGDVTTPTPSAPLGVVEPVGLGTGGLGLVLAEMDAVHTFGTVEVGSPATEAAGVEVRSVVDAASLPNAPLVLLGSDTGGATNTLAVHTDVGATESREPGELMVTGLTAATVGPYGYGYLLAEGRIVVVDLLTYTGSTTGAERDPLSAYVVPGIGGTGLPISEPVAVDWIFGTVPTADP